MSAPVRVMIADDQALVHAGLRMILEVEADLEVVGEAADGTRRNWSPTRRTPTWS